MSWFSGISESFDKAVSKDVAEDLEKAVAKGMSTMTAVIAGLPVVGHLLSGFYAASSATELVDVDEVHQKLQFMFDHWCRLQHFQVFRILTTGRIQNKACVERY